jgi:hypothetical protein
MVFSIWSVLRSYNQDSWSSDFSCQLSSAWEVVKTEPECLKLVNLQLEVVARKRLVKTQQAEKGLVGAVVIYELWRLAVVL